MITTFKFCVRAIFSSLEKTHPLVHKLWVWEIFSLFYIISTQRSYIYKKPRIQIGVLRNWEQFQICSVFFYTPCIIYNHMHFLIGQNYEAEWENNVHILKDTLSLNESEVLLRVITCFWIAGGLVLYLNFTMWLYSPSCYYCHSNWSVNVAQILIQYITSGWPIHLIKFADQFIWSSSSRYSYTSCERANSKYLIISGHFLSIYDWLVAQTTKVIGAFKLFNRKFTIILGSVWIFRGTWWNELVSPR